LHQFEDRRRGVLIRLVENLAAPMFISGAVTAFAFIPISTPRSHARRTL
jgi:hypothetical protein